MLINFKVKNFRSIKEEVVLNLQATSSKEFRNEATYEDKNYSIIKTAVIYGANASGKSNLLKAVMSFKAMVLESLIRRNISAGLPSEFFKLNTETQNKPSGFEISFLLNEKIFTYGFEFDKERIYSEWLKKGNIFLFNRIGQEIIASRSFKEASEVLKKQTDERVLFLSVLGSYNKEFSKEIIELIKKIKVIHEVGDTLDYTFGEFIKNPTRGAEIKEFNLRFNPGVVDIKAKETFTTASQLNIPDKFKSVLFEKDSPVAQRSMEFLYKKYNSSNKEVGTEAMNFMLEESFGTQNAFALSGPIIDSLGKGNILLIDELNLSLHPILCQYLITIFNSKKGNPNNAQLIFTTHDVTLLDENLLRRDQIYFTDKNKFGVTELFSLADISERKGVSFAKRYLEGRYKAIPYIHDYEDLKFSRNYRHSDE